MDNHDTEVAEPITMAIKAKLEADIALLSWRAQVREGLKYKKQDLLGAIERCEKALSNLRDEVETSPD